MQRVFRLSFAGLLAFAGAGLTACGDKVTIPPAVNPSVDSVVHSVTVSPPAASVTVNNSIQLAVSVDAGAGVTVRTVTWSTSDGTVASVDQTGKVTGVKAGTATIIAKSTKDPAVSGASVITVTAAGAASVSIGTITQNPGGNVVDLSNAHGQLDVVVNFDVTNGATVSKLDLLMNCNAAANFPAASDTVVATQTFASANAAPLAAEAALSQVTMSFNSANFNATNGNVSFKNGACVLRSKATLAAGTQTASSLTSIALNNTDIISVRPITTTASAGQVASATDANGILWRAGAVNVAVVPVIYSAGRSIATTAISLINATGHAVIGQSGFTTPASVASQTAIATLTGLTATAGVVSASFPNDTAATAGVGGVTADSVIVAVNTVDNQGNAGPSIPAALAAANFVRLDNRAPNITFTAPSFVANQQNTNAGWVGKAFVFSVVPATGAALNLGSATTDNGLTVPSVVGVAKVVDTTQWAKQGTTVAATFANFTSVTSLAETPAATGSSAYDLRLKICDALGNCRQSPTVTTFGVDLTAPVATVVAGSVADKTIYGNGVVPNTTVTVGATDPQGANGATGSGFSGTPLLAQEQRLFNSGTSSSQTTCTIGTPNGAGTACASPIQQGLTLVGTATDPGEYTMSYSLMDQAGNQTTSTTVQYYIDGAAPTVTGGIAIPASVTAGATFTSSASDLMDVAGANGILTYPIATFGTNTRFAFAGTMSPVGVAFDNALTRSGTATIVLPSPFYRSLTTISNATPGVVGTAVKPDSVGVRASDAAGNLSTPNKAIIPAANVSGSAAQAFFTSGASQNMTAMVLTVDNASVSIPPFTAAAPALNPLTATFTANVTAASLTSNTPFSQMCFYVVTPNGTQGAAGNAANGFATNELSLISCTSTLVTIDAAGVRTFKYTTGAITPNVKFGAGALQYVAIGSNANGDALVSAPVTVTLTNP